MLRRPLPLKAVCFKGAFSLNCLCFEGPLTLQAVCFKGALTRKASCFKLPLNSLAFCFEGPVSVTALVIGSVIGLFPAVRTAANYSVWGFVGVHHVGLGPPV